MWATRFAAPLRPGQGFCEGRWDRTQSTGLPQNNGGTTLWPMNSIRFKSEYSKRRRCRRVALKQHPCHRLPCGGFVSLCCLSLQFLSCTGLLERHWHDKMMMSAASQAKIVKELESLSQDVFLVSSPFIQAVFEGAQRGDSRRVIEAQILKRRPPASMGTGRLSMRMATPIA